MGDPRESIPQNMDAAHELSLNRTTDYSDLDSSIQSRDVVQ
jgi:hypothetical protein